MCKFKMISSPRFCEAYGRSSEVQSRWKISCDLSMNVVVKYFFYFGCVLVYVYWGEIVNENLNFSTLFSYDVV